MSDKPKWLVVGSLRKNQKGDFYIKMNEDISLKKDQSLTVRDVRKNIQNLAARGFITETEAQERIAKIPEYVKYDLVLAPPKA